MSLAQDLRLLTQHLNDAAHRIAAARQTGSPAGALLAAALQGSQRAEPEEIQAHTAQAERATHRAEGILREGVELARRYGTSL